MMKEWDRVIFDLLSTGLTERQIGERIGVDHSTVNQLKIGLIKDPKYTYATKLLELHRRYNDAGLIGKPNTELGAALENPFNKASDTLARGPLSPATGRRN